MPEIDILEADKAKFNLAYNFLMEYWYSEKVAAGLNSMEGIVNEAVSLARVKFNKKQKPVGMESAKGKLREGFALNLLRIVAGEHYDFGFTSQDDDQDYGVDIIVKTKDGLAIGAIDVKDESYLRAMSGNDQSVRERAARRAERQANFGVPVVTFAFDYDMMGLGDIYPELEAGNDALLSQTPIDITHTLYRERALSCYAGIAKPKVINAFNNTKGQIQFLHNSVDDYRMSEFLGFVAGRVPSFESTIPF